MFCGKFSPTIVDISMILNCQTGVTFYSNRGRWDVHTRTPYVHPTASYGHLIFGTVSHFFWNNFVGIWPLITSPFTGMHCFDVVSIFAYLRLHCQALTCPTLYSRRRATHLTLSTVLAKNERSSNVVSIRRSPDRAERQLHWWWCRLCEALRRSGKFNS